LNKLGLAEKDEHVNYNEENKSLTIATYSEIEGLTHLTIIDEFTQDDIDEILALIGWEYEVYWLRTGGIDLDDWHFNYWKKEDGKRFGKSKIANSYSNYEPHTKLSAAKAALIAVVEREYI